MATNRQQPSLQKPVFAVQRRGTDLGIFPFLADLMVLGYSDCLILVPLPLRG